jgi:YD repeat-containing protein
MGRGNLLFFRHFTYDDKGNVVANKLYGSLTGTNFTPIHLKKDGSPEENGAECELSTYIYSTDGRNLMTVEKHPLYQIEYKYEDKRALVIRKLLVVNGQIRERHFYNYDASGAVTQEIKDDGNSKLIDNLEGVSARKITLIKNSPSTPILPLEIEERFLDLSTLENKLFKKQINTYDKRGQLKAQEIYGSDGELKYTLQRDHDTMGNIILEKDPLNQITTSKYDANGNKIYEQGPNL